MDLAEFQHLNEYESPEQDMGVAQSFVERPALKQNIRRKPLRSESMELVPLHAYSSQDRILKNSYDKSGEPFVLSNVAERSSWKRHWQWEKHPGSENRPAWFTMVILGLILDVIVFLVNTSILAWSYSRFPVENYTAVVFTGSCTKSSKITAAAELAINIASTLLLAASSNCAQVLIRPTRSEVDRAHGQGVWIHVGPANMRNLKWIERWRVVVWALLFLSSLPLHLLYNSIIYSSAHTSDWIAAAVTEEFLDGGSWNESFASMVFAGNANRSVNTSTAQPYLEVLSEMQSNLTNLTKLTNSECQSAFGTVKVQSPYLNVLVITNYTSNDSFIDGELYHPESGLTSIPWFNKNASNITVAECAQKWNYTQPSVWSLPVCACSENECILERAFVQNCLAQPAGNFNVQCTVSISLDLLVAVIVCNGLKAVCFICTLRAKLFHPLVTVGDAVASFMNQPDPTTVACGPLSVSMVEDRSNLFIGVSGPWNQKIKRLKTFVWKGAKQQRRWGHAIGNGFDMSVTGFMVLGWLAVLIELAYSWNKNIISSWSHECLKVIYSSYPDASSTSSLALNVLFVNTPQLAVSLAYVFYSSIFTRMLVAYEFSQYGKHRKALRVSSPRGAQRSTYWLQLPYRYILPLMTCMALLHFFISRGIYLVNVKVYNIFGQREPNRDRFAHATSALALLFAFLIGTIMFSWLLVCSYRKLGQGIPLLVTNSVAISCASHPALGDENAAEKKLLYGTVDTPPGDCTGDDRKAMKHVCFSNFEVGPLEDGQQYY